jgi:hypothetical protein
MCDSPIIAKLMAANIAIDLSMQFTPPQFACRHQTSFRSFSISGKPSVSWLQQVREMIDYCIALYDATGGLNC